MRPAYRLRFPMPELPEVPFAMPTKPFPRLLLLAPALTIVLLVSACVSSSPGSSANCGQDSVTLMATLPATGKLQPEKLAVCQDQAAALTVTSERDGELHLHGYDDQKAEVELQAGTDTRLEFTASHVGQFVLELHPADGSDKVQVGVLTVNVR